MLLSYPARDMLRPFGFLGLALTATLALSGCDGEHRSTGTHAASTLTACGTNSGRGCAQPTKRVDLARPSFSDSTSITNPLFPISRLRSTVLLGHVDGKPFRTETTLLPGSATVDWDGRHVRVLVSQYLAYLDGRLEEVAIDRYAQADNGSVWYFGEDVFDYRNGTVALTEGTWLAGREGPAAMIMPADPKVGDVYRTENVAGVVFEEVTVKAVGRTVTGPRGPVEGAMVANELHADETGEDKIFAPGYGEFRTSDGGDLEALALAVPTDASNEPTPAELVSLSTNANGILELSRIPDWKAASAAVRRMSKTWQTLQSSAQPPMIAARLNDALGTLTRAVLRRQPARTAQAAIRVAQSVLDLELRHRPVAEINTERFHLWTQQLRVDAADRNVAGVTGDVAVLEWIRDRFVQVLDPAGRQEIDSRLRDLRTAVDAGNLPAAADHAARLGARVRVLA